MQQIPFIDLFKSDVHVSGDKLAHLQEHFWYNAPILLPNLSPVGSNIGALYQKLYIQSKVLLKMGEFVARNMYTSCKNINKRNLLHLVGCLHRSSNDARSRQHQVCKDHGAFIFQRQPAASFSNYDIIWTLVELILIWN